MRRIITLATLCALAAFAGTTAAQEKPADKPAEKPTLVIRGGAVFDAERLELHQPAQLWIAGDKIIGEKPLAAPIPDGVATIDASGCTLLPGMFDLHTRASSSGMGFGQGRGQGRWGGDPTDQLRSQVYCGVTHLLDLHGSGRALFSARTEALSNPSLARLQFVGGAMMAEGSGGGPGRGRSGAGFTIGNEAEIDNRFETVAPFQPDFAHIILDKGGWGPFPPVQSFSRELYVDVLGCARKNKLAAFVTTTSLEDAKIAVRAGVRALARGVTVGKVDDELIEKMKANQVGYIAVLSTTVGARRVVEGKLSFAHPLAEGALSPALYAALTATPQTHWATAPEVAGLEGDQFGNLKRMSDAGVLIGTGTDSGNLLTPHGPAMIGELTLMISAGLTNAQALHAATLGSAKILGVADRWGTLNAGQGADVVLVRGNPLQSIDALWEVQNVIKDGMVVDRAAIAARNARRGVQPEIRKLEGEAARLIDDFDDGDKKSKWGGEWAPAYEEVVPVQASNSTIAVQDGVLKIKGEVKEGIIWGAYAGATLSWDPDGKVLIDASGCKGVRLRIRGTPRLYSFSVRMGGERGGGGFVGYFELTKEWQELELPFTEFRRGGSAFPEEWVARDLLGIDVLARNSPFIRSEFGPVEFEIDWIKLY